MGYDLNRFSGEVDKEFICAICMLVLENPIQLQHCEHSFCEKCIADWLQESETCPVDRRPCKSEDLKPVARPLRNLLHKLQVKCDFESSGCDNVIRLDQLENHVKQCKFNPNMEVTCDKGCGLKIIHTEYSVHNCIENLSRLVIDQQRQISELNTKVTALSNTLMEQMLPRIDGICIKEGNVLQYASKEDEYPRIAQSRQFLTPQRPYFEMKILEVGRKNIITIGLTCKDYPEKRHPGWDQGSIGYHGDDGKLFVENGWGVEFGPIWTNGDTIGCGIKFPRDYASNASCHAVVYFKLNSAVIGEQIVLIPEGGFFPTVGMRSIGAKVAVNLFP